jgi:hypothetical protein
VVEHTAGTDSEVMDCVGVDADGVVVAAAGAAAAGADVVVAAAAAGAGGGVAVADVAAGVAGVADAVDAAGAVDLFRAFAAMSVASQTVEALPAGDFHAGSADGSDESVAPDASVDDSAATDVSAVHHPDHMPEKPLSLLCHYSSHSSPSHSDIQPSGSRNPSTAPAARTCSTVARSHRSMPSATHSSAGLRNSAVVVSAHTAVAGVAVAATDHRPDAPVAVVAAAAVAAAGS